jgi:glutamyl-tRNA(Gln) amidotransferase subunit D
MNLICACKFIAETEFADVAVCMHKSVSDDVSVILPGTKVRKMHTSRRDAFKAVNAEPWAEVSYKPLKVVSIRDNYRKRGDHNLKLKLIKENLKIGIVAAHPNMFASELSVYENFQGLVLIGTGLGHFPISKIDDFTGEHKKIFSAIKKLSKKMPVIMSPQTIFGRLQMNVYSPGRIIQEVGVIGNYSDMTPETTFIKLAWLLSNNPKHVKKMMLENIRGELSSRTPAEGYLE